MLSMGYLFPDFFALEIAVDINWSVKKDAKASKRR